MGSRENGIPYGSKLDRLLGLQGMDISRDGTPNPVQVPAIAHTRNSSTDPEHGFKLDNLAQTRAPLPAGRSQTSLPSQNAPSYASDNNSQPAGDQSWGPAHPCYPHSNPHVSSSSPLYSSTRIIRIRRDWMIQGDLAPTFSNLYPEILDPVLPEDQFRLVIGRLNDELTAIFNPRTWRNWLDLFLGVVTFWIWEDAGLTATKKRLQALENWIADWNRDYGAKEGVTIIPLRRTGYMNLDIQIPDPHIQNTESSSRPETQPSTKPSINAPGQPHPGDDAQNHNSVDPRQRDAYDQRLPNHN
ncbi:MAG: hypothetical protein M1833_000091 [Piccolia ochrophora]|nr:MAG: hypothetical protein M1833_000091 [Piccolia ochrophora]